MRMNDARVGFQRIIVREQLRVIPGESVSGSVQRHEMSSDKRDFLRRKKRRHNDISFAVEFFNQDFRFHLSSPKLTHAQVSAKQS